MTPSLSPKQEASETANVGTNKSGSDIVTVETLAQPLRSELVTEYEPEANPVDV